MILTYPDALDFLYSLIDDHRPRPERYAAENMPLSRPRHLMARLGNPQAGYPILHVTGTKGKGSVGAMLAAILQAGGYRVGLYSSPHLQDFRERLRINGALIEPADLVALVQDARAILADTPGITWFEAVTALAFEHFRRQAVDIAIIEVGIGGRLDATNIVSPLVSVITSLSLDHTRLLGDTLSAIAYEKAGIIKPQTPVISAPQPPEAQSVIEEMAHAHNAPLTLVGRDWHYETLPHAGATRERWQVTRQGSPWGEYQTNLLGAHQALNGTVALAALHTLHSKGFELAPQAIPNGLAAVNWPGRLEIVQQAPTVILDSAHNGASAACLADTLRARFPAGPYTLVFAAKADKDIDGMFRALLPIAAHLILTQPLDTRGEAPAALADRAREAGYAGSIDVVPIVAEALAQARNLASKSGVICVTGSMYLVGEVRTLFGLKPGVIAQSAASENDYATPN